MNPEDQAAAHNPLACLIYPKPVKIDISTGFPGCIIKKAEFIPGKDFKTELHCQFITERRKLFIVITVLKSCLLCLV